MLWAKGANSFIGNTRVSRVGDAYELASSFGDDFSELLVTGEDPFRIKLPSLPSMHRLKSMFGGAPKESACDAFGRMGVTDMVAGKLAFRRNGRTTARKPTRRNRKRGQCRSDGSANDRSSE